MKTLILTAGIAFLTLPHAGATSVTFTAAGAQRLVEAADLTLLNNTNTFVWVGNFTTELFGASTFNPLLSISANVTAMKAAGGWRQFGFDSTGTVQEATTFTLGVASTSKLSGTVTDTLAGADYFGKAAPIDTRNLYLWIFRYSGSATVANATEMGIFRSTDATIPWTFLSNLGGVGDTQTYSTTASAAPTVVAIGGAGSTTANNLILAVPEPSVLALGTLACVGILSGRRRKRQA
ncbi:MAG: hypothetical protein ABIP20_04200 [Chthoniobacteraceae bacterium]